MIAQRNETNFKRQKEETRLKDVQNAKLKDMLFQHRSKLNHLEKGVTFSLNIELICWSKISTRNKESLKQALSYKIQLRWWDREAKDGELFTQGGITIITYCFLGQSWTGKYWAREEKGREGDDEDEEQEEEGDEKEEEVDVREGDFEKGLQFYEL